MADVPDAESYFYAHEFLDVTVQPKPIYISPNEVYTMHGLLLQHLKVLVSPINMFHFHGFDLIIQAPQSNDTLRVILNELVGVPNLADEELKDARDTAITLELTNRFATVGGQPLMLCFSSLFSTCFTRSPCRRKDTLGPGQTGSLGNPSSPACPGPFGILDATGHRARRVCLGGYP